MCRKEVGSHEINYTDFKLRNGRGRKMMLSPRGVHFQVRSKMAAVFHMRKAACLPFNWSLQRVRRKRLSRRVGDSLYEVSNDCAG